MELLNSKAAPIDYPGDVRDVVVARALKIIHERFAENLDVASIAREAGVSRSVLGERFVELLGEPPMRYCARVRMRAAANMLREGKHNTANIAYAVGFNSEAAFNRAFKREFGQPPVSWKRTLSQDFATDLRPDHLLVSGTPTGVNWVTRHIDAFLAANPDLSVELEPDMQMADFDRIDCAIRCGTSRPVGLRVEDLFEVDFTPMCSPDFLARHPELRTPAGLLEVTRITPTDAWWPQVWQHFGLEAQGQAQSGVVMGAQVLDGMATMRGHGVALLTPMFWRDEIASGSLVCPFEDRLDGGGAYWFVYPESRAGWSKIRRFSDWLHGLCEAEQPAVTPPVPET